MKKEKYLLILLFISTFFCFGQEETDYLEYHEGTKVVWRKGKVLNGKPHGNWKYYDNNGILQLDADFDNGLKHGMWIYYIQSKKSEEGEYKNDKKEGTWIIYDIQGVLYRKENYKNGEKDGVFLEFYNGKIAEKGVYKNGIPIGTWETYYSYGEHEGKIKFETTINSNSILFPFKEYYYNENITDISSEPGVGINKPYYAIGSVIISDKETDLNLNENTFLELHGNWKGYYKDGAEFCSGNYDHSSKNNSWKYYFENGNLMAEGVLKNDQRVDTWKFYYNNEKIKEVANYITRSNGESHLWGENKEYYENGNIKSEGIYDLKREKWTDASHTKNYYENGKIESIITRTEEDTSDYYSYFENGNIKNRTWWDGKKLAYFFYYENGNLKSVSFYNSSKEKTGVWKEYNEDGTLKETINYSN